PTDKCEGCKMWNLGGRMIMDFKISDPVILELIDTSSSRQMSVIFREAGLECKEKVVCYVRRWENLEEVRLIPVQDVRSNEKAAYVIRRAFYAGHGIDVNKPFNLKIYSHADPRTQHVVHIFSDAEPMKGEIDSFKVTPDLVEQLRIFQPSENQSIEEKLNEIHDDFSYNVHRIFNRNSLGITMDLVIHSVLHFQFLGQFVEKGWAEAMIIGDTGIGKSTIANALTHHYQVGEIISGETSSRTGITYTMTKQENGRYMIEWGAIPRNDRGLVIIDEFAELSFDEISKLTEARSSGRLKVQGAARDETLARTRLIFLTNPRTGRAIADYDYGVLTVVGPNGVFQKTEDVRRLDLLQIASIEEVNADVINERLFDHVVHKYTSYLCKNLICWAWSRRPDQIIWEEGAEKMVLDYAKLMSDMTWPAIPIVHPADQRFKIARLAVGLAARLFSTDDGNKLIVKKDHVQFVFDYMVKLYESPSCGYLDWSANERRKNILTEKNEEFLIAEFKKIPKAAHLKEILMSNSTFRKSDLQEQLDVSKEVVDRIIKFLSRNRLIKSTARGYVKQPYFIKMLKKIRFGKEEMEVRGFETFMSIGFGY
ncbi:MAG: hypothetical protein ACTSWW_04070, partial [Promethearchaeota archaeon]